MDVLLEQNSHPNDPPQRIAKLSHQNCSWKTGRAHRLRLKDKRRAGIMAKPAKKKEASKKKL